MATAAQPKASSFRASPAKLEQHKSKPMPTFWDKASRFGIILVTIVSLAFILLRLWMISGDVLPFLMGTSSSSFGDSAYSATRSGSSVASFRFDDDFESLTEEKKAAYLDEIAKALGVESVDAKAFRKGSVIVDINVDKDTAAKLMRESQTIGDTLQAEVSVDSTSSSSSSHRQYHHHHGQGSGSSRSWFGGVKDGAASVASKVGLLYFDETEETAIVLQSGDHVETDRGLFALAKVSGLVFHDRNANGVFEYGEDEGVEGVRVLFVRAEDGEIIAEMITDRHGQYHFSEKEPGDYFVSVQLNSGYRLSPIPDPELVRQFQMRAAATNSRSKLIKNDFEPPRNGNSSIFALHSGSQSTDLNAAVYQPARIEGFTWEDILGDGHFQPGMQSTTQGVTPTPLGPNAMADLILQTDPDLPVLATVALEANGAFLFDNVMPGTYQLKYSLPADHYFVRSSLDQQKVFTVISGSTYRTNVGFYRPVVISGSIYEDLNAVGWITGKETEARRHIRGARIQLNAEMPQTQENNKYLQEHRRQISSSVVTSPNGEFKFEGFAPGVYHLVFTPPEGYKRSKRLSAAELAHVRAEDPEAMGSDAMQESGATESYTIRSGAHFKKPGSVDPAESDITVLMYTLATLGGYIWEDRNADGIFDDDEKALPNVEVRLSNSDHTISIVTFTNERGHYLFKNLEPGRYLKPAIVPPANHQLSNVRITFKYVDANDRRLLD